MEIERLQKLLRLDVEGAKACQQPFIAELNVLRCGHGRDQTRFLIDHADAGGQRVTRRMEVNVFAVDAIDA